MDFFKKVAIGVIVGLILMLSRKYLFLNVIAAERNQQAFDANSFVSLGVFNLINDNARNSAYWTYLDGGYQYLSWTINDTTPDKANAFFFFNNFNYDYDYAYFTIFQSIGFSTGGNCSTLSQRVSILPIAKLGDIPCEVVYTRDDNNYGQRVSYKCPITNSNHLSFFYTDTLGHICSTKWGIQNSIIYYKGNESLMYDTLLATQQGVDSIKDSDISSSSKESIDSSNMNNYNSKESDLFDSTSSDYSVDDTLDIGIDANGSQFLWDTITRFLHTHAKVFGCVISMLSLGIIKLVLGR